MTLKKFIGNTSKGGNVTYKVNQKDGIINKLNTRFYYHSSIMDTDCVAIVEIVANNINNNIIIDQYSIGWTYIRLFDNSIVKRWESREQSSKNRLIHQMTLFCGTPRGLMMVDGPLENFVKVVDNNPKIEYAVDTFSPFKTVSHLLRENEFINEKEQVVGIQLGIENSMEKPILMETYHLTISNIKVNVSERFEIELANAINSNKKQEFGTISDKVQSTVAERRLIIGIHNGRTMVQTPVILPLEEFSGYLSYESHTILQNYFPHIYCAIFFQLEYVIRLQVPIVNSISNNNNNNNSKNSNKETISYVQRTIPIGYYPLLIFDGSTIEQGDFTIQLHTGPTKSPLMNSYIYSNLSREELLIDFNMIVHKSDTKDIEDNSLSYSIKKKDKIPIGDISKNDINVTSPLIVDRKLNESTLSNRINYQEENNNIELNTPRGNYQIVNSQLLSTRSVSGNRAIDALRLNNIIIPEMIDRHGNKPFELRGTIYPSIEIDILLEQNDVLNSNQFVLQFLMFQFINSHRISNDITLSQEYQCKSLFFTLQFYTSPLHVTKHVGLVNVNTDENKQPIYVITQLDSQGNNSDIKGYTIKFTGEGLNFINYMKLKTLYIQIWNGDSMLLIGTVGIELKYLLRQQRDAVQYTDDYDIVSPDIDYYETKTNKEIYQYQQFVRGKLTIRVTNIGMTSEIKDINNNYKPLIESNRNKSASQINNVWSRKYAEQNKELANALQQRQYLTNNSDNVTAFGKEENTKKRKMSRMIYARQQYNNGVTNKQFTPTNQARKEKEIQLKLVQLYRDKYDF